jgi:hypothetical protein
MILFEKAGMDQLVDPEIHDALGSDPKKISHFLVSGHAPVLPEEVAELPGYALDGSPLVHGLLYIEHMFYGQEDYLLESTIEADALLYRLSIGNAQK